MITQTDIISQLDNLKRRNRDYFTPKDYKQFLPLALPTRQTDRSVFTAQMQAIMDKANSSYDIQGVKHQNQLDYERMLEAQRALHRAQNALGNARSIHPGNINIGVSGGGGNGAIQPSTGSNGHYADAFNVGVGQNLGHYNWNGFGLTLNRSVADNFLNFLNSLHREGYKINSIGTYANRNIAGTGTKSLHAYGLAMDINPSQNPVSWNGRPITNLPPDVGRLAARYGLAWGGNWHGSKRDTMHFSVPYGGTK